MASAEHLLFDVAKAGRLNEHLTFLRETNDYQHGLNIISVSQQELRADLTPTRRVVAWIRFSLVLSPEPPSDAVVS